MIKYMFDATGPLKYTSEGPPKLMKPGMAIGMAANAYGGTLCVVEASKTEKEKKGSPNIKITGRLGETLKESVDIAFTNLLSSSDPRFKVVKGWFVFWLLI